MAHIRLYHTGFLRIETPDIRIGRANADFGQGFYLSDDASFSKRWAKQRRDSTPVLNTYELNTDGLRIKRFERDAEWFDYIFKNRSGYADSLSAYDLIIGPIANDTIYDTWGIITSGLLSPDLALELLRIGAEYRQYVVKTDRAVRQLAFLGVEALDSEELAAFRAAVKSEEEAFQTAFAARLSREPGFGGDGV